MLPIATFPGSIAASLDGCCPAPSIPNPATVKVMQQIPKLAPLPWGFHPCGAQHCGHPVISVVGNPTVLINKLPVMTLTSSTSCGPVSTATSTVGIGGALLSGAK
jgi:hypothetical protein